MLATFRFRNVCLPTHHLTTKNSENFNLAWCVMWMCNFVSHVKGRREVGGFENWVIRKMLRRKSGGVKGHGKFRREKLHNLHFWPNFISVIKLKWTRRRGTRGKREIHTGCLVGAPEEQRPPGRHRNRW